MTELQSATTTRTEADAVAEVVQKFVHAEQVALTGPHAVLPAVPVMVVPEGQTVQSIKRLLDEYRTRPERREGTAKLLDLGSFVDHVNRFRDPDSIVYADNTWKAPKKQIKTYDDAVDVFESSDTGWVMPSMLAVLDYHQALNAYDTEGGVVAIGSDALPRFGRHRASYTFELSEEFKAWTTFDGAVMSQGNLAHFLEERCLDVIPQPLFDHDDAALTDARKAFMEQLRRMTELLKGNWGGPHDIMDMSRTMRVHESSTAETTSAISSGTGGLVFHTEHTNDAGEKFQPKDLFLIQIPIFRNGPSYQLPVRLRYRLKGGRLWWFYELFRVDKAFDNAFEEACEIVSARTNLPVLIGHPEK